MKAIQYTAYGDSSVIKTADVEKPVPKENEILIKVTAITVNPMDMKIRSGALQKAIPVQLPFVPGLDIAGTVEAVGAGVSRFKTGDAVFATTLGGTYAEYAVIDEAKAALQPANVSTSEAASLAIPIVTAYTALVQEGQLAAGQRVLVHGAAGGVGSIVVQMAKAMGAYVIGTASGKGVSIAKELGADEIIDYKTADFSQQLTDIDLVADLVGGETQTKSFAVIKKGGKLISLVMPPSPELAEQHGVTAKFVSSEPSFKKLEFGRDLVEKGKIKTQIARTMKLDEAAAAQDLVSAGGVDGKVVLVIE